MNNTENTFLFYMKALKFLSESTDIYGLSENGFKSLSTFNIDISPNENSLSIFFSRSFLREKKWSIFPLWEGDLRTLRLEDGSRIEFINKIRNYCLANDDPRLNTAAIESTSWEYSKGFSTLKIAHKAFDLYKEDPSEIFENSIENVPYWGFNFFWPDSEKILIYTNGDNASFIAGDSNEIENILGLTYQYCMKRFMSANLMHQTKSDLIFSYKNFCDESLANKLGNAGNG